MNGVRQSAVRPPICMADMAPLTLASTPHALRLFAVIRFFASRSYALCLQPFFRYSIFNVLTFLRLTTYALRFYVFSLQSFYSIFGFFPSRSHALWLFAFIRLTPFASQLFLTLNS